LAGGRCHAYGWLYRRIVNFQAVTARERWGRLVFGKVRTQQVQAALSEPFHPVGRRFTLRGGGRVRRIWPTFGGAYRACSNFVPTDNKQRSQPSDAHHDTNPDKPQARRRRRCSRSVRSVELATDHVVYDPDYCRRHPHKAKSALRTSFGFVIPSEMRRPTPVYEL
jgi:hypothetical protein